MNVAIQSKHGESSIIIFSGEMIMTLRSSIPEDIANQFSSILLILAGRLLKKSIIQAAIPRSDSFFHIKTVNVFEVYKLLMFFVAIKSHGNRENFSKVNRPSDFLAFNGND